jgi:hypothetical protein
MAAAAAAAAANDGRSAAGGESCKGLAAAVTAEGGIIRRFISNSISEQKLLSVQ